MARSLVLAVDEGTTGVTCAALDEGGVVRGRSAVPVRVATPRPGWVEQDADQLWSSVRRAARDCLRDAKADADDVAGVGLANQRETTIVWDKRTGVPVGPAIVWQDRRTAARCDELRAQWEAVVRTRTGLVVDPYFCATKLEWILREPSVRRRARAGTLAFGTVDAWLAWKLTGRHVTDQTNASRTMLWDIRRGEWDAELLELFGVPEAMLPEVVASASELGPTHGLAGRAAPAPLCSLVGDQQAALVGQGCTRAGQAKVTYGTGAFLLQHTGSVPIASRHGLITTRAASAGRPAFALEGSVFVAGALVQWLRDGLGVLTEAADADRLARQVPDAGGVVVVPAFTGLGAPHWDAQARGMVLGLTRGSDVRHIVRACLEAIAHQTEDVLAAMRADSGRRPKVLRVDGGATRSAVLLQAQADLSRCRVARARDLESTARGAAVLAGHTLGWWPLQGPAQEHAAQVVAPVLAPAQASVRRQAWRRAVAACRTFTEQP